MEKARTQRTLVSGTANRLGEKHAKPRPGDGVLSVISLPQIRGFQTRL
jgi:hypothetical protein